MLSGSSYVINSAKEARNPDPTAKQRLVYLSVRNFDFGRNLAQLLFTRRSFTQSAGANPRSPFLYPRLV